MAKQATKREAELKALWQSLPASNIHELSAEISKRLGRPFSTFYTYWLMSYVRKHAAELEWTIPHVSKGDTGAHRFFGVLVDHKTGFTVSPEKVVFTEQGVIANLAHVIQRMENDQTSLKAVAVNMRKSDHRLKIEEIAADCGDVVRKMARVLKFVRGEAANG